MKALLERKELIKNIIRVSTPAVLEMSLNTMLMVADTIMISRMIGNEALSGARISNSILFLLIIVFASFNTGSIAMIARNYGEKNMDRVKKIAGVNLSINLIIGVAITIFAFLIRDLLFMPYEITDAVRSNLESYFSIVLMGMSFQFGSFAFASISRGVEDTKTPMKITGFVNVFNIVFNYLLIKGVWIFPTMGIKGAALATTLARVISFMIYIFIFSKGGHKIIIRIKDLKITNDILKGLWKLSYPSAVEQFLMQTAFVIVGIFITALDTTSEALFGILINIESTSFMPALGISIATATLVGKSLGENDKEKASEIGYISTGLGVIWGLLVGLVFFLMPKQIISIFTTDIVAVERGLKVMFFMAINQPLLNFMIVMGGALRGAGDTKAVMRITSLRLWLIFVPFTYIGLRFFGLDVESIWYAEIFSFVVFSAVIYDRFRRKKWAEIEV